MKKLIPLIVFIFTFSFSGAQTTLTTATDFSVKDIEGNTIQLFDLLDAGYFVCIDFFSTSCGPCSYYSPEFQLSFEDFGENSGNVYHFSICWGDDNIGVSYYQAQYGLTFPAVSGFDGGGNQVYWDYDIQSYPTVILIHPDRTILEQHIWEPTRENINNAIVAAGGILVGIDEQLSAKKALNIYPNPATNGMANISVEIGKESIVSVDVFNLLGELVHSSGTVTVNPGIFNYTANVEDLPKGTYFVTVSNEKQVINTSKLIISR
jgi:hypothetical protein